MKKTIIALLAATLVGCSTQPAPAPAPTAAPAAEPAQAGKLCDLATYQDAILTKDILADAVRVEDHGLKFTFTLVGDNGGPITSDPLIITKSDRLKSVTDRKGYFFAKGTGEHEGIYSFANENTRWVAVFNCKNH